MDGTRRWGDRVQKGKSDLMSCLSPRGTQVRTEMLSFDDRRRRLSMAPSLELTSSLPREGEGTTPLPIRNSSEYKPPSDSLPYTHFSICKNESRGVKDFWHDRKFLYGEATTSQPERSLSNLVQAKVLLIRAANKHSSVRLNLWDRGSRSWKFDDYLIWTQWNVWSIEIRPSPRSAFYAIGYSAIKTLCDCSELTWRKICVERFLLLASLILPLVLCESMGFCL